MTRRDANNLRCAANDIVDRLCTCGQHTQLVVLQIQVGRAIAEIERKETPAQARRRTKQQMTWVEKGSEAVV